MKCLDQKKYIMKCVRSCSYTFSACKVLWNHFSFAFLMHAVSTYLKSISTFREKHSQFQQFKFKIYKGVTVPYLRFYISSFVKICQL